MAGLGRTVTMVEHNPILFALLADGLSRVANDALRAKLGLVYGNSARVLPELAGDVVYLDPMFEQVSGSALPGRELQILRQILPPQDGVDELLATARAAFHRVVVKRGDRAAELGAGVSHCYTGKTVRYDVYINPEVT